MRAREPDVQGYVERDGVKVGYEVFGDGPVTVLLMPTWQIIHSRFWKAQVPFLARHYRVITFDPRGNGRSGRPSDSSGYAEHEFVADALTILDATGTESAVVVALCHGSRWAVELAACHPARVRGLVSIGGGISMLAPALPENAAADETFDDVLESHEGWAKYNRHYWQTNYLDFVRFFFDTLLSEPHSTKQLEDCIDWALETDADVLLSSEDAADVDAATMEAWIRRIGCPVLVIQGTADRCQPAERGARLAEMTGGQLIVLEGAGHLPQAREPVAINMILRDFVDSVAPPLPRPRLWTRSLDRPKRVLYLSSAIGLGHARRDLAVARALRERHPGVQVDWLTQEPVSTFLEAAGERVHPASAYLASESAHIESESGEHDLHAFQAIRRMDEILVANFMVFHDLVSEQHYDLWVGDEAWDIDFFLHENPELKSAAFAWLTDFVGWLPMPDGGRSEALLTADYNAEMVEHVARFPRLRDRSIFVGDPDDLVPELLGPGLPCIREWTEAHFDFAGYITGSEPGDLGDREELRARLGYAPDEKVCLVSVGGSGVGEPLLRRVVASYKEAKNLVPELRMVVVAGPRIDPDSLPRHEDLEIRGLVPDLHRHHAACDIGVVQGGLTTTMELTAANRPFLYFPLRHHFEQNFHVRHRLERHKAGRCMDFATADPDVIASAIADEVARGADCRPVTGDGAQRAAGLLAELI
jgi:pimeloyl-ACP methyl ester carboxylesterase/predicted glycosyltransferase